MSLEALGLSPGERVRFRRRESERWKEGAVERQEKDGSLGIRDDKGAARAIPLDLVEVRASGPRGGSRWEPVAERASRTEQLPLW
jgi:hypothetical protein